MSETNQNTSLTQAINDMRTMRESYDVLATELVDSKQTIVDAIIYMGGNANVNMTWAQLAQEIESLKVIAPTTEFDGNMQLPISIGRVIAEKTGITKIVDEYATDIYSSTHWSLAPFGGRDDLQHAEFKKAVSIGAWNFSGCKNLRKVILPKSTAMGSNVCQSDTNLNVISIPKMPVFTPTLAGSDNVIDMIIGEAFVGDVNFGVYYNANNARLTTSSSLCFDTDLEDYGRTFANNFEKWKWCIINHFAAMLK